MPTLLNSTIDNRISKGIVTVRDRDQRPIVQRLLTSSEPSIVWKIRKNVLDEDVQSKGMKKLQQEIKKSERVKKLLSERKKDGTISHHPYTKWIGAHWILSLLADLGYPPGDKSLIPLREQVYDWLLSPEREKVKVIQGRARFCGSMEGNAIYSLYTLGLADKSTEKLAERLIKHQWPDGGWNCDKKPEACHSSFHETLLPLRGLYLYARASGNTQAHRALERAAEVYLQRYMYRSKSNGKIINPRFLKLHYPSYWHYSVLAGLKVLAETHFIHDTRCNDALDLLEGKRLPDKGFPAEEKLYTTGKSSKARLALVNWGGVSKVKFNEWVTADALYVLRAAGR